MGHRPPYFQPRCIIPLCSRLPILTPLSRGIPPMREMPGIPNKYIIIPNRGLWSSVRNRRHTTSLSFRARAIAQRGIPLFCVFKMRFFTSLCSVQNDISAISNIGERSLKNVHLARDFSSLTVVRMTSFHKGGSHLSFRVRPVGRRGISYYTLSW